MRIVEIIHIIIGGIGLLVSSASLIFNILSFVHKKKKRKKKS